MSWEPTWVPDGRGGFRRNRAGSEEGEEVEDGGGERKENESEMKNSNNRGEDDDDDDDSEEEGEIAPAGAAAAAAAGPPSQHHRSTSSGHLDSSSSTFRGPYRGRGHNNNPRFARPPRQPRNTSFSGAIPPHFNREGSFSGSNNSNPTPFEISSSSSSLRKNGPPPPPPPPPPFRGGEPPPFRDSHNPRDIMDAPPPRGAGRDYRDLSGPRGDGGGGAFGGREFRKEPPPLPPKRDFGEGPPNRDFRGGEPPLPPNRDFRGGGEPPNRDFRGGEPPNRDFRGEPPSARDFRGEPPNRDFRGGEPPLNRSPANRDFRADGGPPNNRGNFRDRAEGISHPNRDFRDRDTFGSDVYPNPNKDRGDNRDTPFGNAPPLHRESSFGAGPGLSPTPAFRDGPAPRDPNFRDGPPFRDGPSRDGPFRDGPSRDVPFREGPSRETSFHKRETSFSSLDRGRPAEPPLNREPSFGTGPPREPPFGLNRGESGGPRDHSFGGPRGGPPREPGPHTPHGPFHRESNRDEPTAPANFSPAIPNNKLVQTGPPTAPPKGRPTDPRRRPSKDIGGVLAPQGGPTTNNAADLAALDPRRSPGSMAGPPFVDGSEAPPPPHHRVSSYSSLADTSSMAATGHDGAPNQGSRPGGSFRSPVGRRALVEPGARNDRGDRYGPAGPTPQRHWSPASDRNRPLLSNNAPTPDRQQSQSAPSQQPPFVPFISSRPSNFRSNDPRFKHHQEKTQVDSAGRTDSETNASSMPPTSTDPFGRSRDWKDRPFGHQTPNTTPRSSPLKQKTTFKPFSSSPPKEKNETKETKSLSEQPKVPSREPAQELPPLLMSLLSDEEEIKRAKTAVQHLSEVISGPSLQDRSTLPTKQLIMEGVAEIEKLLKENQKEFEDLQEEKIKSLKEEEDERQREAKMLEEEENQKVIERDRRAEERRQREEEMRTAGLKKSIEDNKEIFLEAKKKLEEELEVQIRQAKEDEKKRCYEDTENRLSQASENVDKDIAKARRELEKAKITDQKLEAKVASLESEYKSLLETEESEEGDSQEESVNVRSSITADLVASITASNKRRAAESQMMSVSMMCDDYIAIAEAVLSSQEPMQTYTDPKHGKTFEDWSLMTKQVTGLTDALYSEPSESPYFEQNERTHSSIGPSVKEYVRDKETRLLSRWAQLAEEYEVRKRLYEKQQKKLAKKESQRSSISVAGRKSILGDKETDESLGLERGNIMESSGRSNNPYRRARRGNEVRSEYEQEQIIAEIAAKEAMEKRIAHGGSKLPRQICHIERESIASYFNTFAAHKVDDPLIEAEKSANTNIWSDMEKCIFLDRFLQFPKDFRRIASFLRNKTTKDCVAFYYDSKQTVPYKGALKEHVMRRKRRGDYQIWDASIQAAISVGAVVTAGSSEEKPVVFSLPSSDRTYNTRLLHPLKREVLDPMPLDYNIDDIDEDELRAEEAKWKSKKRSRDPLFCLDKKETKFLRMASQESMIARTKATSTEESKSPAPDTTKSGDSETAAPTPGRKAPQKWTASEKKVFVETYEQHGRDWAMLSKAVGTKSLNQIKNFYYDYKKQKQAGKQRPPSDKKVNGSPKAGDSLDESAESKRAKIEAAPKAPNLAASPMEQETDLTGALRYSPQEEAVYNQQQGMESNFSAENLSSEIAATLPTSMLRNELDTGNRELIHQLLNQQLQQQKHQQQLEQHQQQQQLQLGQQPQSAIQQLLSQQHHQREQQQQQQASQLSLEEARRMLQHQSHHQQVLSGLLPWVTASQVMQAQSRLPHALAAAALQQEGSLGSISDISDVTSLQRLLQMQQASQNPYGVNQSSRPLSSLLMSGGLNPSASSGLPPSLLNRLEHLGGSAQGSTSDSAVENLSALARAQAGMLGYGGNSQRGAGEGSRPGGSNLGGSALFRQAGASPNMESAGVSDALSMLARSIPRAGDGSNHGFGGGMPDRKDGADRYNG